MIVYHGSNVTVEAPRLLSRQRNLDFRRGFYTTSSYEQASSWAQRSARIRKSGEACISCFELDDDAALSLNVHRFEKADLAWLEYVAANRRGTAPARDYDLVIGPVANDQTFPTILLYLDGYLDAESTIRQLLPQRLKDQYVFKTERALSLLHFVEVRHA